VDSEKDSNTKGFILDSQLGLLDMSFRNPFGKSLSNLRFDDIETLKDRNRAEDEILEYKVEIPGRLDLQKEVLGFANNLGGYLVIGVATKKPENTPELIVGVAKEDNIAEKIVSTVRDNSSPSFVPAVQIMDMPSDSTKCIIVVHSHESDTIHRASDGRYYYRTANETIPIRPEFVAKIIGKSEIHRELVGIVQSLNWKNRPEFTGANIGHDCWFGIICCPVPPRSFTIPLFSENDWYYKAGLSAMSGHMFDRRAFTNSFRVYRPRSDASPWEIVEFYEDGLVLYGRILAHGSSPKLHDRQVAPCLDRFLHLAIEAYRKVSFDGGLLIVVSFNNILKWDYTMGGFDSDFAYDITPSNDSNLEIRHETTVSAIISSVEATRNSIMTKLRRHFNIY